MEKSFTALLRDYPDSLADRRRLSGLLKDLMPGKILQTNLLLNLYDVDIHKEIEKASIIDNAFRYRFIKRLCDEYGVSQRNSEWAVGMWDVCYGGSILGKRIIAPDEPPIETRPQNGTVPEIFDISSNSNIEDWRNIYEYEIVNGVPSRPFV